MVLLVRLALVVSVGQPVLLAPAVSLVLPVLPVLPDLASAPSRSRTPTAHSQPVSAVVSTEALTLPRSRPLRLT